MRKRINLIIVFYVLYFAWLLLIIHLWPNPETLTYFLLAIVAFYFLFLYEKRDIWFFLLVIILSWLTASYFSSDPSLVIRGVPPLGIPYWPLTWGISALAFRKFYLLTGKAAPEP